MTNYLNVDKWEQVCVMSADFWGLKTAGGTATAYHLLAAMLAKSHALEVGSLAGSHQNLLSVLLLSSIPAVVMI